MTARRERTHKRAPLAKPTLCLQAPLQTLCVCLFPQGRNIIVFYGSQTGTAEEFANRLSKDAHRYGMRGMSADPEEYDLVSEPTLLLT